MKRWLLSALLVVIVFGVFLSTKYLGLKTETPQTTASTVKSRESLTYWTCPMHPQIHSDHPGECPICHMKLVEVKAEGSHEAHVNENENRSAVQVASDSQLALVGVQKTLVEKMDLTAHIPVAGRFISSSSVAFQVYESDLKYVKSGLAFTGESSFAPESDLSGIITSVDNIVDPTSRTVRAVGIIKKGPRNIIPETTFRGDIEIQLKSVVGIPESSVLHTGDGDLVYMIHDGGHLMAQPVKLGLKTESYYVVLDGLEPGEYISSGPNFLIDSEAKIRGAAGGSSGHSHH